MDGSQEDKERTTVSGLLRGQLPLETETSAFILLSVFDLFLTTLLMAHPQFRESNPVAAFFFLRWGLQGMILFKFSFVTGICLLTQFIARYNHDKAKFTLNVAVAILTMVVLYSAYLYVTLFS